MNFENLTGVALKADSPYPKKIRLPCKFKLESAVGFKNLSVTSREAQEENLSHVKWGRRPEKRIAENFDDKTGVHPPSMAHCYQNAEKDENMISMVCGLKPFQEISGRNLSSFPHLSRSPFDCVEIRIIERWLKSSKRKLARDSDTPWGDEEHSSSSDEDLDET